MEYASAPEVDREIRQIIRILVMDHIDPRRVRTVRSRGSQSRRIIARCHALPKALQTGLRLPAFYVIELVSENFDRLPKEEKIKTLIHELLHIPRVFGGGFRNHDYVRASRINQYYKKYVKHLRGPGACGEGEKRPPSGLKPPPLTEGGETGDLFSGWISSP